MHHYDHNYYLNILYLLEKDALNTIPLNTDCWNYKIELNRKL